MKRLTLMLACLLATAVTTDAFARGGGGRGAGGGGGRGFGGGYGGGRGFSGGYGGGHSPSFGGYGGGFSHAGSYSRPSYAGGGDFSRSNFGGNSYARGFNGANFGNRSNLDAGNRVGGFDRTNVGNNVANRNDLGVGNRANINNWTNNRAGWNNNINNWANRGNRPWSQPFYNHYNNWHNDWHHGYWNYWGAGGYPWAWAGLGALGGWGLGAYDYAYSNPYYVAPVDDGSYYPDYSQPIPPPSDAEIDSPPPSGQVSGEPTPDDGTQTDPKIAAAMSVFDEARKLFKTGDYDGAIKKVDVALKDLPSDAALHEFRALCLFAEGKYKEAAAGVYAVLAAGPGWDWNTVKALYPDTATYTKQLRALEDYKKANPNAPDASFLLAYQYLVLGFPDQAAGELKQVVKLQPSDKLSAALLQALEQRNQPQQQPAPTPGS